MSSTSFKILTFALPIMLLCLYCAVIATADRDVVTFARSHMPGSELAKSEQAKIAETIKSYNFILSDFYASGGVPSLLDQFPATKTVKHGVFRDLGYIKSAGRVLVYDHAASTPKKITLTSPDRAEAVVFEEWNYMYQSLGDRKPLSRPQGFGQGFRYTLIREQGKWLVDGWDTVMLPDTEKKREFLF